MLRLSGISRIIAKTEPASPLLTDRSSPKKNSQTIKLGYNALLEMMKSWELRITTLYPNAIIQTGLVPCSTSMPAAHLAHLAVASWNPRWQWMWEKWSMDQNLGHQAKWIPHARWGWKLQSTINIWQPTRYNTGDSCCATLAILIWAQELYIQFTRKETQEEAKLNPPELHATGSSKFFWCSSSFALQMCWAHQHTTLFGHARKVKEHAAKIEKATQTCPVQSLEVQCQNTAL